MAIRAVIFDMDGTLLDTLDDLAGAVNRTLECYGYAMHPVDDYRYFLGDGAEMLVRRALPAEAADTVVKQILDAFGKDYLEHWADATHPFPEMPELLQTLAEKHIPAAILSNKPHRFVGIIAERFFPGYKFAAVYGQRADVPRKPDPTGALMIARELQCRPAEVLYVGDSGVDMRTAVAAGMVACGALWGFREEPELREAGAAFLVEHPLEIAGRIARGA